MYGIGHISVIPVREQTSDTSQMVTQLLFGEVYEILETSQNGKWKRIKIEFDGYEGWIDTKQYHWISKPGYEGNSGSSNWLLSKFCVAKHGHTDYLISFGSYLPDATLGSFLFDDKVFKTGNIQVGTFLFDQKVLQTVIDRWMGTPYLWGGKSIFGVDCSGFVQLVFRAMGIKLPRDARDQAKIGNEITNPANTLPGDLLFFGNDEGKIVHVAIYMGDNTVAHASGEVRLDIFDDNRIYRKDIDQYTHQLSVIKRIF